MTNKIKDVSKDEILSQMKKCIDTGWTCFVKWTCEKCGERVTCNTPNAFFTEGYIHEDCGHISFPNKFGLVIIKGI